MATPQFVPNDPLDLAKNLRFEDRNGNTVTRQLPADYIVTIGADLSQQIDVVDGVITALSTTNANVSSVQAQVNQILASGATAIPTVSSGCLSSGTNMPIDTVVNLLVSNSCAYNNALGTTSSLYQVVAVPVGYNLNTAQAFSQESALSGISGWISTQRTVSDTLNNLWITVNDSRAGITRALTSVTPTCSQVIVDYLPILNSGLSFNLYFSGYSFIPTGFTDAGSTVKITDSGGNIYQTGFNIVTQSTSTSPLVLMTSGSALSPTASSYQIQVSSNVTNTSLGLTCQKTIIHTVSGASSGTTSTSGPDIGNYTQVLSSGTSIAIVTGLSYTPRAIVITPKNTYTATFLYNTNNGVYLTYTSGGGSIVSLNPVSGTLNLDWIAYR